MQTYFIKFGGFKMITFKLDNKSVVLDNLKSASFHFVLSPYNNETSDRIFKFTCILY